jgi:tetratricopeptide (TPR) repeat protein
VGDHETAVKFFNQAVTCVNDTRDANHLGTAYQLFSSARLADPDWFDANYQCGNNNSDLDKIEAAVANWRCALWCASSDHERAKALVNLGWRLHTLGKTREAFDVTERGLELDSALHLGWVNLSLIHSHLRSPAAMVAAARKAYEIAPDDVNVQIALAFACMFTGAYAEGLRLFEARFEWRLKQFLNYPYPRWTGEPDRTVFLVADQGLGDTLSFARFVEAASCRCAFMHLYIQPPLYRLFQHAFAHLRNINLIPSPAPFPPADYWTTFVSLPFALGLTDEQVRDAPQIKPPPTATPSSWKVPDRLLHIGIAWSGAEQNDINRYRNIPVEQFFDLYRVGGIQLYSLQKDERHAQMHTAGGAALVRDLTPYISDVVDTCGLLRHLDMVICCESALGHITAMTGTPCWHPYAYQGRDWRLGLSGEMMLWRPSSHRVFRQEAGQSWQPVFDRIVEALREKTDAGAETEERGGRDVRVLGRG